MLVGILAALPCADDVLTSREIDGAHAGLDLVGILPAPAVGTEGVKAHLLGVKGCTRRGGTETKIKKPFFALLLQPIQTAAHLLDSAAQCGQIVEPNAIALLKLNLHQLKF